MRRIFFLMLQMTYPCNMSNAIILTECLKSILRVNASEQINLDNIIQLKQAFDYADSDKTGKLDMDEVFRHSYRFWSFSLSKRFQLFCWVIWVSRSYNSCSWYEWLYRICNAMHIENWCEFRWGYWLGWVYELHHAGEWEYKCDERRGIIYLLWTTSLLRMLLEFRLREEQQGGLAYFIKRMPWRYDLKDHYDWT